MRKLLLILTLFSMFNMFANGQTFKKDADIYRYLDNNSQSLDPIEGIYSAYGVVVQATRYSGNTTNCICRDEIIAIVKDNGRFVSYFMGYPYNTDSLTPADLKFLNRGNGEYAVTFDHEINYVELFRLTSKNFTFRHILDRNQIAVLFNNMPGPLVTVYMEFNMTKYK